MFWRKALITAVIHCLASCPRAFAGGEGPPTIGPGDGETPPAEDEILDVAPPQAANNTVISGWVYLGRFKADGTWQRPRSEDLIGTSPDELEGRPIVLSMDVNVRARVFVLKQQNSDGGCDIGESEVIGALESGREVVLTQITRFPLCDSYIWAEVRESD
ncbi:hypothetical protein [Sinorhizobium meliloti]|uniref:hypothetical protein n=1 Tax=Rhizobium meliloti TaxID=382 RepID=UPI00299E0EC4|nr:hypothetical protein [Sinorhizobium meliloti]